MSDVVVGRKQRRVHVHWVAGATSSEAIDVVNDERFLSIIQLRNEVEFVAHVATGDAAALQAVSAADHLSHVHSLITSQLPWHEHHAQPTQNVNGINNDITVH